MTEEIEEMSEEEKKMVEEVKKKVDKEKQIALDKLQAEALEKQKERNEVMGELLRSKGFLWLATSNNLIGAWQQAGNVLRIKAEAQWMCLTPHLWEGTPVEEMVCKVSRLVVKKSRSESVTNCFSVSRICKKKMETNGSTRTDGKKLFLLAIE